MLYSYDYTVCCPSLPLHLNHQYSLVFIFLRSHLTSNFVETDKIGHCCMKYYILMTVNVLIEPREASPSQISGREAGRARNKV